MPPPKTAVILEWTFAPPDYFEGPIRLKRDTYVIALANGKVEVRIDATLYDHEPTLQQQLHDTVNGWFLDAQRANQRPYHLSQPRILRVYYDATKDAPETASPNLSSTPPKVVAAPRLGRGSAPVSTPLAATYGGDDPLLANLLRKYDAALADPEHELAGLGAVRDALAAAFGDPPRGLAIDEADWNKLAELASAPATGDTARTTARTLALRMILACLRRSADHAR